MKINPLKNKGRKLPIFILLNNKVSSKGCKDQEAVQPMIDGIAKTAAVHQITFHFYTHLDKYKQLFHKSNMSTHIPES